MNIAKIEALKQIAAVAENAYTTEQTRLVALGLKSNERYAALKGLKAATNIAHAEYSKFAKGQINRELCAIIAFTKPAHDAAARARSPWKQAKFDAAQK